MNINFQKQIDQALLIWNDDNFQLVSPKKRSFFEQKTHYHTIKGLLKKIRKKYDNFELAYLTSMKDDRDFEKLLQLSLGIEATELKDALKKDYVDLTKIFVERARTEFPEMDNTSIFQALRNVWIMVLIQYIAGHKVYLSDAMYAYSMLYPLTDNIIDNEHLDLLEKNNFLDRFEKRLSNQPISPNSLHETQVYEMVALIEGQYPRDKFSAVYESLLCIHHAQKNSLKQQSTALSETELLKLSFEKGAASVIADGYLVLGTLPESIFAFLTKYGIVLQLADDLQDLHEDLSSGHLTIFNTSKDPTHRMLQTQKLINFSEIVLNQLPCEDESIKPLIFRLLLQSMSFLINDAVFTHSDYFPTNFYKDLSQKHVVGIKSHLKLKHYIKKQYGHFPL